MAGTREKINKVKLKNTLASMASLFETGRIKKMKDITTMYPTGIVAVLGINYGGYITKCTYPEKFSIEEIIKLSRILKIDSEIILTVIKKEAIKNVPERDISDFIEE